MSNTTSVCAAVVLIGTALSLLPATLAAQDSTEPEGRAYASCQSRFAVIFPGVPAARDTFFMTVAGASVPAREFSFSRGADRFAVTVVDFPDGPALDEQVIDHAADSLRKRGEIRMQFPVGYAEGVRGRQILVAEPNGRQLRGSVYMHDHRIFITEVSSTVGDPTALQFDQSITITDNSGVDVDRNARRAFTCR